MALRILMAGVIAGGFWCPRRGVGFFLGNVFSRLLTCKSGSIWDASGLILILILGFLGVISVGNVPLLLHPGMSESLSLDGFSVMGFLSFLLGPFLAFLVTCWGSTSVGDGGVLNPLLPSVCWAWLAII